MFAAGGIWNIVTTALAVLAVTFGVLQLANKEKNYRALIVTFVAMTFFMGVAGYGIGIFSVVSEVDVDKDPTRAAALMTYGHGYAATALAWGCLMSAVGALVGGIAIHKSNS